MSVQRLFVILSIIVVVALCTATAGAANLEKILIPRSSSLSGTLAITNHSESPVTVYGAEPCFVGLCIPHPISPNITFFTSYPTQLLKVESGRVDDISVQYRVHDASSQSETWGTSIPVVRESGLFDGRVISITDIPNTPNFRSILHVFGFDIGKSGNVSIRIFAVDKYEIGRGNPLLVEFQKTIGEPLVFSTLELPLWEIPGLAENRLRVEVEGPPGLRLWAFATTTNTKTQHMTVLAPISAARATSRRRLVRHTAEETGSQTPDFDEDPNAVNRSQ